MDKLNVLKKMCVAAAVLCLPLWYLAFSLIWGGWAEESGVSVWLALGGVPLALVLLIAGYVLKRRRAAAVLCAAGLAVFAVSAVWSVGGVVAFNNAHFMPFADMSADTVRVDIWQGRDEAGDDTWQAVEDDSEYYSAVVAKLAQVDCYTKPQDADVADRLAVLDLARPAWHFRVSVAGDGGNVWRLTVGDDWYILSKNGEEPQAYQARPTYYENWQGYANSDLLYDYEHLLAKYAE